MERTPVSSTMIGSIGYDDQSQTLEIAFNRGGVYQYFGVGSDAYGALMAASSHGKYFLANIKDRYPSSKQ